MTSGATRRAAFSLMYPGHNIGFSLRPVIAGFLFIHALPWLFIGDALTTFIALTPVFVLVPESKPTEEEMSRHGGSAMRERAETGGLLPVLLKRPYLIALSFIALLLTFVYSQYTFSLPLQLQAIFPERGPVFYGVLMTVNALVVIFLTAPAIAATRKMKPVLSVALSALLFSAGFGMIYFPDAVSLFVVSTIIWTVGEILQATNINVYIANHTPISHRGRFNSILPIMGDFIELVGMREVWLVAAAISVVSGCALVLLHLVEKRVGVQRVPAAAP